MARFALSNFTHTQLCGSKNSFRGIPTDTQNKSKQIANPHSREWLPRVTKGQETPKEQGKANTKEELLFSLAIGRNSIQTRANQATTPATKGRTESREQQGASSIASSKPVSNILKRREKKERNIKFQRKEKQQKRKSETCKNSLREGKRCWK
jgi:hypothetical protein